MEDIMLAECRKCGSSREIKLKINGEEMTPICTTCGEAQPHFSRVMINTMRANKDIMHSAGDEHVPFGFPCSTCKKTQELVYDKKSKSAKCSVCGAPANVSPFMLRSLELTGHVKRSSESTEDYEGRVSGEDTIGTQGKGKIKRQAK